MNTMRGSTVISAIVVVATASAQCGPPRVAVIPAPSETVVLLAEADGTVGRVTVSNAAGSVELTSDRAATRVTATRPPTAPSTMSAADVQAIFSEALSAQPPAPQVFELYFEFESDELTPESLASVSDILRAVGERPVPEVAAIGHTDTTGTFESNVELGRRRAATVRSLLIEAGLEGMSH